MNKILSIILISIFTIIIMTGCNEKVSSENTKADKNEESQDDNLRISNLRDGTSHMPTKPALYRSKML